MIAEEIRDFLGLFDRESISVFHVRTDQNKEIVVSVEVALHGRFIAHVVRCKDFSEARRHFVDWRDELRGDKAAA